MDNIAVFGCKATTYFLLENLGIPYPIRHIITISPEAGAKHAVADYYDLKAYGAARGIEVYTAKYYSLKSKTDQDHINSLNIDLAFVIGWQRLIPAEILSGLNIGAFGMHGSSMNLPLGRGRSPMNWSIIENRNAFYTNLFRYDPGVDSGDVVDTFKFQITPTDTAETMHFKNTLAMKFLIEQNVEKLVQNSFRVFPQNDQITPTYYPKRTPNDSLIDWSMDVYSLERFIRAVTRPFNGAFTFVNDQKITFLNAQVFDLNDFGYDQLPVGTIAAVFESGKFLVKCYGGLLLVNDYEADFVLKRGMLFHTNGLTSNAFSRNDQGYFDLPE
ncbi:MAG: methionyl-tRNA formyltransferase [Saprospiraceae bacterium]|nr:MAG: methionyl-tRNA formyltransferase [Saprospiraceae bacterium]